MKLFHLLALVCLLGLAQAADDQIYRMCVPQKYYQDCLTLLKDPSEAGIKMECIAGRDRIDCLDKINERKADVLASEPEDMYVAYHNKNEDYRVISEIRTKDDKDAPFRYEGIIMVKKDSNIHSLKELRGAKSCHTGFGRNVGYRIPITKLKNADILKVSLDPSITASERELKALSEFFSKSCLVGTYSPYPETDRLLKKKYANLCALCENPQQCNYPDKFSGYDGAIRCLDKGQGEVAFTKVQYIKKYFGMTPGVVAENDKPEDFEYLCEDGSRRPITGPACSWAQRPWMGYISNVDAVTGDEKLHNLQHRLEKFFENGLHAENKEAAAHLLINENAVYHSKPQAVEPKEYLEKAGYKDVIERDGSAIRKMKWCVQADAEADKCNDIQRAAYSRDIRPEIECVQEKDCIIAVQQNKADFTVIKSHLIKDARDAKLQPIVYENFAKDNVVVAVVDPSMSRDDLQSATVTFDSEFLSAKLGAIFLNKARGWKNYCSPTSSADGQIHIIHTSELEKYKNKQLLCANFEKKPVTDAANCNIDFDLSPSVVVPESKSPIEKDTIRHLFISLSNKFGANAKTNDVYQLFDGNFNGDDVIFDNDGTEFVAIKDDHDLSYENNFIELLHCNSISKN